MPWSGHSLPRDEHHKNFLLQATDVSEGTILLYTSQAIGLLYKMLFADFNKKETK